LPLARSRAIVLCESVDPTIRRRFTHGGTSPQSWRCMGRSEESLREVREVLAGDSRRGRDRLIQASLRVPDPRVPVAWRF